MKMHLGYRGFYFYDPKSQANGDCLLTLGFNFIVLFSDNGLMDEFVLQYLQYGKFVYTTTKYGVKGLDEALRLELKPYNIGVSIVYPGYVETGMLDESKQCIHRKFQLLLGHW